jgi:hypothetical protein
MVPFNEENIKKNKEVMTQNAAAIGLIMAPIIEKAVKSVNDFADYIENKPTRTALIVATDSYPKCKCGSIHGLRKYKGKYYCSNCLDKKLRW